MIPFYEERDSDLQISEAFGMTFPPHMHTAVEMVLIDSGSMKTVCNGKEYTLKQGDFFICFPNSIHSYSAEHDSAHFYLLICHPSLIGDYLNELMNYTPECPVISGSSLHRDIPYAIHGLLEEHQSNASASVYRALTQLILARSIPHLKLCEDIYPHSLDLATRTVKYISKNFTQPLSLETVSKQVGVSKCHLSHVFSTRLHTGFNDYVNSLRLNLAQNLLRNTDKDILEISLECGFESQRTFNRAFVRLYSTTPGKYRTSHRISDKNGQK